MMRKMKTLMVSFAAVLIGTATLGTTVFAEDGIEPVLTEVEGGRIMGYTLGDVNIFKGIPYAQAERFEMPEQTSWDDILSCLNFSEVCPQHAYQNNANDFVSISNYFVEDREEDSFLTVNVWTKDMEPETLKPVLFWIHGGGYASGSSAELEYYDGYNMADYGDIVFVSVNHRLNYLGYMDLSAYGEDYKYTGNLGHADIIAALEWVQNNISKFGGDPNNVTIEGQSGGGTKVTQLLGMPAAKDLFQKAVAQSGGSVTINRTTEVAQADTAKLVEYLGLSDKSDEEIITTLKEMDYDDLYDAAVASECGYGATVDGDFYPTGTYEISKDKPVIFHSNLGEFTTPGGQMTGKTYPKYLTDELIETHYLSGITEEAAMERITEKYGDRAQEVIDAYKKAYPSHDFKDLLYTTGRTNALAETMVSYGNTNVYQSVQAYNTPYMGGTTAQHTAGDIPFWFRNLQLTDVRLMIEGDEECALKVSDDMSNALIQFCYTGNPSTDELNWETFTEENGETMIFDRTSEVRNYHDKEYQELVAEIQANNK